VKTLAVAVALGALAAAGCGSAKQAATPAPPKLPRALAQLWAQQADAIAAALTAGDGCTAETQAAALRAQVAQAVNDGRIPRRYLEPLVGTVNALPARIACNPAPTPAPGKHGQKDKHGGQGKGDD